MHHSASDLDKLMDRHEVCISINESERSVKSSLVSVLNRLQQVISDEVGNKIHNLEKTTIEEDLLQHSEPSQPSKFCWIIQRVPYRLRQVNEMAYVPKVISIGPYHHDKEHLRAMEAIKIRYFGRMIKENEVEGQDFVEVMKMEEEKIRKCYEEPLDHIDSDTFVKMLVLDGCFILQLFQKKVDLRQIKGIHDDIQCDLLLVENQLPFFVLLKLYSIITKAGQQEIKEKQDTTKEELHRLALRYFEETGRVLKEKILLPEGDINRDRSPHLLGLVRDSWLSSYEKEPEEEYTKMFMKLVHEKRRREEEEEEDDKGRKISCWPFQNQKKSKSNIIEDNDSRKLISNATYLENAGIKLKKKVEAKLLDITFAKGTKELEIPRLVVDDNTELILRNMMAYEQFIISSGRPTLVCHYVAFMDNLIDSAKDVQLLYDAEIIDIRLGDNEAVAKMFNKLRDFTYSSGDPYCKETSKQVVDHCSKGWYKFKAEMIKKYFSSPWALCSSIAALVFLFLTVVQFILSVLSFLSAVDWGQGKYRITSIK